MNAQSESSFDVEVKTFLFTLCSAKMSKQEFENKPAHFKEIVDNSRDISIWTRTCFYGK